MKFLIFNLAVGAALIYLVTADRGDMHNAADRLYDATQGARSVVNRAVGDGRKLFEREDGVTAAAPAPARPREAEAAARITAPASQDAAIPTPPDAAAPGPDLLAPPPVPSADRVAAAPRGGGTQPTPEALRRRAEILGGRAAPAAASAAIAAPSMAPDERRRQLYSLAEEMELLYARSLAR